MSREVNDSEVELSVTSKSPLERLLDNFLRESSIQWVSLILIAIVYQSCPTLTGDWVQALKVEAASAIQEDRLPIPFYGLSYLPLLTGMAVAARWLRNRGRADFSLPMTQFITGASVLLAAVSVLDAKAAFLVNAISVMGFVFYGVVLRQRRFMLAAIGSLIVAVGALVPFANAMDIWECQPQWSMLALSILGLLMVMSRGLDRLLSHRCFHETTAVRWFGVAGETVTGLMACTWVAGKLVGLNGMTMVNTGLLDGAIVTAVFTSMVLWTIRSRNYLCGLGMWAFALLADANGIRVASLPGSRYRTYTIGSLCKVG